MGYLARIGKDQSMTDGGIIAPLKLDGQPIASAS
jgi:hypothetical protein